MNDEVRIKKEHGERKDTLHKKAQEQKEQRLQAIELKEEKKVVRPAAGQDK